MKSIPASIKGARVTGPTIGIRYSKLVTHSASPPGKITVFTGKLVEDPQAPDMEPSGLRSGMVLPTLSRLQIEVTVGKKAIGPMGKISNPRISFSPTKKNREKGGGTRPPYPLIVEKRGGKPACSGYG